MAGKHILYVGTLPPFPGGTAVLAAQLLKGLAEQGNVIRAFAPSTAADEREPHPFAESHPNLTVQKFLLPHHPTNSVAPIDKAILESMRQNTLGLLEAAMEAAPADAVLIGRESFLWGVPALADAHGLPCIQIAHAEASAVADGGFGDRFAGRLIDEMAKAHRVVAVAEHLAARLRVRGLTNLTTIPNPVEIDRFTPGPRDPLLLSELDIAEDAIVVMHASNWKPVKRVSDILASVEHTTAHNRRLCYLFVGGGVEKVRDEAEGRDVTRWCRFADWVDHAEIDRYYRLADIFLMPSETEAMALAYLEAMASGCLLLASDIPAAREAIVPGETGLLHPVGDVDALAAETLRAAEDTELRQEIGTAARSHVTKTHALGTVISAYDALIEEAAGRR